MRIWNYTYCETWRVIFAGAQRTVHVLHNSEQPASVFAILESGSKVVPLIADGLFDLLMLKMTNIYTSKKQTKIESKGPRFEIGDFCVKLGSVTMSQNFKGILVEVRATLHISLEKKRDSPKIRPSAANFFIIRGISSSFSKRYSSSRLAPTWRIVITFNSEINFSHKFAFKNYFSTQKYKSGILSAFFCFRSLISPRTNKESGSNGTRSRLVSNSWISPSAMNSS